MDWSLLACGKAGHVTYAPAEPDLREQLRGRTSAGEAWRCLRCGSFVPGEPGLSGPAAEAPQVRRGPEIRSAVILRVFAVEKFVRALVFLALAYGLWQFRSSRQSVDATFDRERPAIRDLFLQFGYDINSSKLVGLITHALTLSSRAILLIAIGLALYTVVEVIEGTGLWLSRRWGEYFAMVATCAGLPLEIYDLSRKVTATTLVLFALNLGLVLYLVLTKRLFGVRGGFRAYESRLRSESIMEAARTAAAAGDRELVPAEPVTPHQPVPPAASGDPAHPAAVPQPDPATPAEPSGPLPSPDRPQSSAPPESRAQPQPAVRPQPAVLADPGTPAEPSPRRNSPPSRSPAPQ